MPKRSKWPDGTASKSFRLPAECIDNLNLAAASLDMKPSAFMVRLLMADSAAVKALYSAAAENVVQNS